MCFTTNIYNYNNLKSTHRKLKFLYLESVSLNGQVEKKGN